MAFPDNKNYTLGKGRVFFGRFTPGTRTVARGGLKYLGNTPEFTLATDSEDLPHYDADEGVRVKDDSVTLEVNRTGTLSCDHISPELLSYLFGGSYSVTTQAALTAVSFTIEAAQKGVRYQIGKTANNPTGVRGLTSVAAATAGGSPVTLVAGTDYRVNLETGGIEFLNGSTIVDGVVDIVLTVAAAEAKYHSVVSGADAMVEGELFFEATNPKGARFDYLFPYVQLRPEGDFALKGDDWQVVQFAFEALKLDDNTQSVYTNGRAGVYV